MKIKLNSPWKFVKLARHIRTKTPTQHHVLLALVQYADTQGRCYPSYEALMQDTGYGSNHTIAGALVYLRDDLQILDWKPGHGNQYKHFANYYTFKQDKMIEVLRIQKLAEVKS